MIAISAIGFPASVMAGDGVPQLAGKVKRSRSVGSWPWPSPLDGREKTNSPSADAWRNYVNHPRHMAYACSPPGELNN